MKTLALIPARQGSKSISDKNIRSLNGKPLLAYSIDHALQSKSVDRVIVSTDSKHYATLSRSFGAETPFLRPKELSGDHSTDFDVFNHTLKWLWEHQRYRPDLLVHLRPTYPIREPKDIDQMIALLSKNKHWDSVRSVTLNKKETPYKMWSLSEQGILTPLIVTKALKEPYNMPRQQLPDTYVQNAAIDVTRSSTILEMNSMTGEKIGGFEMSHIYDIDHEHQWVKAHEKVYTSSKEDLRTYCFDIDGVIANISPNNDYNLATPNHSMIEKVNQLHDQGHSIILFTARGSATGIDWEEITTKQMKSWEVRYHELLFGKPAADFYIDDRNLLISEI